MSSEKIGLPTPIQFILKLIQHEIFTKRVPLAGCASPQLFARYYGRQAGKFGTPDCMIHHFPGVAEPLLRNTSRRCFFLDT